MKAERLRAKLRELEWLQTEQPVGLEVEGRMGRPEVLSLQRGKEHEPWSHLDGICEHGERGGQH